MGDERIEWALRIGPPDEPAFQDVATGTAARVRLRSGPSSTFGSRLATVLAAAFVLGVVALVAQATRIDQSPGSRDLLAEVKAAGRIRVVVTNGSPQIQVPGAGYAGFDLDVANAIGQRLGVRVEVDLQPPSVIESGRWAGRWDFAIDSEPSTDRREQSLSIGPGYYARAGAIIVRAGSPVASAPGLAGQTVCVIRGGLGERWLGGTLDLVGGASVALPGGVRVVVRETPDACLTDVTDGSVVAYVADWAFDAAIPAGVIQLPDPPFVAVASVAVDPKQAGSDRLLTAIGAIIGDLRAGGQLRSLSEHRFGGQDLTALPRP